MDPLVNLITTSLIIFFFFLFQIFILSALSHLFRKAHKYQTLQFLREHPFLIFYAPFYSFFFKQKAHTDIFRSCLFAKNLARFAAGFSCLFLIQVLEKLGTRWSTLAIVLIGCVLIYIILSDLIPKLLSLKQAQKLVLIGAPITSLYLILIFPITYTFLKIAQYNLNKQKSSSENLKLAKEKIYELIQDTLPDKNLEPNDKVLIESILRFKQRIVREVMIPRMDVFALSATTTIQEAAKILQEENYSRIPIYQDSLDNVTGMLMHKELFNAYIKAVEKSDFESLNQPIDTLLSKTLYTPETRKISHLLQEFLQKQQHLALVVDEFGAIEGVITIEDILEEIVGEIADEYDDDEDDLLTEQQNSWVVDARVSLFEIEQKCHVKIPRLGDYDTVAGYIIHRSGCIPSPHLKISHDEFELEVLSTSDRQIKKVRITPRSTKV